ncbi:GNAT family N-acetyltransferase [Xanthomonas oryzae]|uniref:GNAT family N-acetyltransferase n=1 Tax=Xanthomonas oryzae TaxID=347 RepID=UPI0002F2FB5E|nr:GNAT family N-acetyltransferase [Xanthomonas oryzae]
MFYKKGLTALLQIAWRACTVALAVGLLLTLDHDAPYANTNFAWMATALSGLCTSIASSLPRTRRRGRATQLYNELIHKARAAGHPRALCEVNVMLANPASLVLHRQLSFVPIDDAVLATDNRCGIWKNRL